jgi:hypothetical protein
MRFETPLTLIGPWRAPAQMLQHQENAGQLSIHDQGTADTLGLVGAPIEAPTHFSQFDPLAQLRWGDAWFERGCISCHFRTMVVEPEEVQATLTVAGDRDIARIEAHKLDGTPVLSGTVSLGPDHPVTELDARRAAQADPGALIVLDRLHVGMTLEDGVTSMNHVDRNGPSYPFSLAEKLDQITEPHPYYTARGGTSSPWGRPIVPFEMASVLTNKVGRGWPVRSPVLGLFLDLEIRMIHGPLFVDQEYVLHREIVGLSQSRRTESYWTMTTLTNPSTHEVAAQVLIHSGVFKESYPGYPKHLLG